MSNEKNPLTIDFDAIDRRIQETFERNNETDPTSHIAPPSSGFAGIGGFVDPSNHAHSHTHDHDHDHDEENHLEIKEPYIVLQFDHSPVEGDENMINVDGFQLTAAGLDPNPEAILEHLKLVVRNIEEQIKSGKVNDSQS